MVREYQMGIITKDLYFMFFGISNESAFKVLARHDVIEIPCAAIRQSADMIFRVTAN
jgi:hypothetical protein